MSSILPIPRLGHASTLMRQPRLVMLFVVFLLAFTFQATPTLAEDDPPRLVLDSDCDCFYTSGKEENYFKYHQFWDFRSLSDYYTGIPDITQTLTSARDAPETSSYFTSDEWTTTWALQNWNNSGENPFGGADWVMMNSYSNVYVDLNGDSDGDDVSDTYLVLRTAKLDDFQSAAEFQTQDENYHYLSMRMYARIAGDNGACAAMFTYREDSNIFNVQEADIEILTSGPDDKVQYTNQPSFTAEGDSIDESTKNVTMTGSSKDWRAWTEYRLDWSPGVSSWYVNGEFSASISFQTPADPASIILNMWGDGGSWTGEMQSGDSAYLELQWFEVVYNTTGIGDARFRKRGDEEKESCAKVCSIDQTTVRGQAVLLYDSSASTVTTRIIFWLFPMLMGLTLSVL